MKWLGAGILVLVMAVVQTTAVPVELTAMVLAALAVKSGQVEMVWLAVWGGVVLGRGLAAMVVLWTVAVVGWAYRRWGGEPAWWVGLAVALGASGMTRWVTSNWSILGGVGDMMAWGVAWLIISWWQDRRGDEMV